MSRTKKVVTGLCFLFGVVALLAGSFAPGLVLLVIGFALVGNARAARERAPSNAAPAVAPPSLESGARASEPRPLAGRRRRRWWIAVVAAVAIALLSFAAQMQASVTLEQTKVTYCSDCGTELARTTSKKLVEKDAVPAFQATVEDHTGHCGIKRKQIVEFVCPTCDKTFFRQPFDAVICQGEVESFKEVIQDRTLECQLCEALAEYKAEKTHLTLAMVKKNPSNYIGRVVRWTGKSFNVTEQDRKTVLGVMTDSYDVFYAVFDGIVPSLVDDMKIAVLGRVAGTVSGKNAFGATVTHIQVQALGFYR